MIEALQARCAAAGFASALALATATTPLSASYRAHICPPRRHTFEMKAEYVEKQKEYEAKKARAKALQLRLTCTICGTKPKTLLNCPCGTTQCVPARTGRGRHARARRVPGRYCSTECQRIDWRDRGHRKACKKIRNERAAEAARAEAEAKQAEAPAPPPEEVFYGPAPRSHADEVRARIAAEHEAARLRREANPEPEPQSARWGSRCPICMEDWDVNDSPTIRVCCCRLVCVSCATKFAGKACPLCRASYPSSPSEQLARLRQHVENEVPEAVLQLGYMYRDGMPHLGVPKNLKKAVKIYKRAVELGNVDAAEHLGTMYSQGVGVKLDTEKAKQLFRIASDRGHAVAQGKLAGLLQREECHAESFELYTLAAKQGLTSSEFMAAWYILISPVPEIPEDLEEARRLLTRAAAKGLEAANEFLNEPGYWTNRPPRAVRVEIARTMARSMNAKYPT